MKLQIAKGSTSQIVTVFIQDASSAVGGGLGSLNQASSIVGGYVRAGAVGLALAVDENVTTEGTYEAPTTDNQVRIGTPANMTTGTYELHFHNDLFATGADSVFITLSGATDMAPLVIEIQLTDWDPNAATDWSNWSKQWDGSTGLIGDTFPLRQDQGASISGGLAVRANMVSPVTVIAGSQQGIDNTTASNGDYWTGDDDGAGAEFIFLCTPADTTAEPGDLHFEGYYDEPGAPKANGATISVYNFQLAAWESHIALTDASTDETHDVLLTHANGAPGSGTLEGRAYVLGDVLIKFEQDTQETGNACLLIDRMYVGFISAPITAAEVADAVLDEAKGAHTGLIAKALPDAVPGAAGGVFIAGTNASLTVTGATTLTGAVSLGSTLDVTGAVTLNSVVITGAATGISVTGTTAGVSISGGTTGVGLDINGGSSSGVAVDIDSTSGKAIAVDAASGVGVHVTASTTAMQLSGTTSGLVVSGATAVNISGITFGIDVDASGGSGVRVVGTVNDILADITGNLSGEVGTLGGLAAASAAKLDDMLDSTGAVLYLTQLSIQSSAASGAIDIDNSGGAGLNIDSSVTDGVVIGAGGGGDGIVATGHGAGAGFYIVGGGGASSQGLLIAEGLSIDTVEVAGTTILTGAVTMPAGLTADITGSLSGSVGSVTAKTGYALAATGADLILKTSTFALAIADAIGDEPLAGHTTIDTIGLVLNEWQDGGRLDLLLDAIKVITDALTAAAAAKLATSSGTIVTGAAEAGTLSTTQMTTDLSEATNDHYNGRIIIWTSGVLQNQVTDITGYTGVTGLLTFTAITEAPGIADSFIIV